MRGAGAIVFLIVFFLLLLATLAMPDIPPGKQIYGALGVEETNYLVLGISAIFLIEAIFNGVVYGIIAWLIFTLGTWGRRKKTSTTQH